jgi:hypothetical protein
MFPRAIPLARNKDRDNVKIPKPLADLSSYLEVVEVHTLSSDWKCVVILIIIIIIIVVVIVIITGRNGDKPMSCS